MLRMSRGSARGDKAFQQRDLIFQCSGAEVHGVAAVKRDHLSLIVDALILADQLIERAAAGLYFMELRRVGVQLPAQTRRLLRFVFVLRGGGLFGDLRRLAELLENVALLRFIGMQLETERADADFVQALLHHLQCRHLLGDKEDALARNQQVRDHRGDRLGLARSGRSVQDKALSLACGFYREELRRVGRHRQHHRALLYPVADRHRLRVPAHFAFHQAFDDFIPLQVVRAVADVVPHDELREREDAQIGGLEHVPLLLIHDNLADDGEHPAGIDAVFIHRQRVKPVDHNVEILLELLENRNVHLRLVVAQAQDVALTRGLADDLDRQKDDRRVTRLDAFLGFVPAQQSHRNIERVRAVFLQGRLCAAVDVLDACLQLVLGEDGAQAVVGKLRLDQIRKLAQLVQILKARVLAAAPLGGLRQYGKILAVGQSVLEIVDRRGEDWDERLGKAQVDQIVAQTQIEQLSLPLHLLGELRLVLLGQIADKFIDFARSVAAAQVVGLVLLNHKARIGEDSLRQGQYAAYSCALHVKDALNVACR